MVLGTSIESGSGPNTPGPESPDIPGTEDCKNCIIVGTMLGAMSLRIEDLEGAVVSYQSKMDLLLWWIGQKFGKDVQLNQILNIMNNTQSQGITSNGLQIDVPEPDSEEEPANHHLVKVEVDNNAGADGDDLPNVITDTQRDTINQVAAGNFDDRGITDMDQEMDFAEDNFEFEYTGVPLLTQIPSPLVSSGELQPGTSTQLLGYIGHNISVESDSDFDRGSDSDSPRPVKRRNLRKYTTCSICYQEFKSKVELNKHKLSHLSVTLLRFPTSITPSTSAPINCNNKMMQNYLRNAQLLQFKQLDEKKDVKLGTKKSKSNDYDSYFECSICERKCSSLKRLQFHMNASKRCKFNPNKGSCKCYICGKNCKYNIGLKHHLQLVHAENVQLGLLSSKV